jgi:hypothetical protein
VTQLTARYAGTFAWELVGAVLVTAVAFFGLLSLTIVLASAVGWIGFLFALGELVSGLVVFRRARGATRAVAAALVAAGALGVPSSLLVAGHSRTDEGRFGHPVPAAPVEVP